MSGPRVRDVPIGALRRLGAKPMTAWQHRDARTVPSPRAVLHAGERWLDDVWINNRYSVQLSVVGTTLDAVVHLWIRAHDGSMPRSWSDLQRIKNDLMGPERVAVEVFRRCLSSSTAPTWPTCGSTRRATCCPSGCIHTRRRARVVTHPRADGSRYGSGSIGA